MIQIENNSIKLTTAQESFTLFYYKSRAKSIKDILFINDKIYPIIDGLKVTISRGSKYKVISKDPSSYRVYSKRYSLFKTIFKSINYIAETKSKIGTDHSMFIYHLRNISVPILIVLLLISTTVLIKYWWRFDLISITVYTLNIMSGLIYYKDRSSYPHVDATKALFNVIDKVWFNKSSLTYHHILNNLYWLFTYINIFRTIYYKTYLKYPKQWKLDFYCYVINIIISFTGYTLVWGQMSFWSAQVLTNLFSSIPFYGPKITNWIWVGFSVVYSYPVKFHHIHIIFPFILEGIILKRFIESVKTEKKWISLKDITILTILIGFPTIISKKYFHFYSGVPDNAISADPMETPSHIAPQWYNLYSYAILNAIPRKLLGTLCMFIAILSLNLQDLLDRRDPKSSRVDKFTSIILIITIIVLSYLGGKPQEGAYLVLSRLFTALYFSYFFIILPFSKLVV